MRGIEIALAVFFIAMLLLMYLSLYYELKEQRDRKVNALKGGKNE